MKIANKREQSQTCLSFAERKQFADVSRKNTNKREQSQTCLSFAERKQFAGVSRKNTIEREQRQSRLGLPGMSNLREIKKLFYSLFLCFAVLSFTSCEIDNYDEPGETIRGKVVDVATGDLVLTDQGSEGTRIRLRELSWTETPTPDNFDFWCMKEGIFQNTKVFKGRYNVRVDGAFIPLVRLNADGDTIADESLYTDIEGVTEVEFKVQPFLKVEWVGEPTVSNGTITATVKVTRAVSPADFKAKVEPMGGYSDNFLNVTDVRLFVSQVPYVGYREWDNRYTTEINYSGNSFEALLGQPVTVTTKGVIPAGRTVFIRAAARINYATENVKRHNYNEALRVDIP